MPLSGLLGPEIVSFLFCVGGKASEQARKTTPEPTAQSRHHVLTTDLVAVVGKDSSLSMHVSMLRIAMPQFPRAAGSGEWRALRARARTDLGGNNGPRWRRSGAEAEGPERAKLRNGGGDWRARARAKPTAAPDIGPILHATSSPSRCQSSLGARTAITPIFHPNPKS